MSLGIFPIVIFCIVGLLPPIVATVWEKGKEGQLTRKPYLIRAVGIILLSFIAGFLQSVIAPEVEDNALLMLIFVPIAIVGYCWEIQRLRNIGWSTHLIWVNLIPLVNLIFSIVLLIKAPKLTIKNDIALETS